MAYTYDPATGSYKQGKVKSGYRTAASTSGGSSWYSSSSSRKKKDTSWYNDQEVQDRKQRQKGMSALDTSGLSAKEKKLIQDYNSPKNPEAFRKSREIFNKILKDKKNKDYGLAQRLAPYIEQNMNKVKFTESGVEKAARNVRDFTGAANEAFLGQTNKGLVELFNWGKNGFNSKKAQKDTEAFQKTQQQLTKGIDRQSTAAKVGNVTGNVEKFAADAASMVLPAAGAEKLVRGAKWAQKALEGGKAANLAARFTARAAGSAASTAAGAVNDVMNGRERDLAKNAAIGTAIDVALPAAGKLRGLAKENRIAKSVAQQSDSIVKSYKTSKDFAKAYSEALDARRAGTPLSKQQKDIVAVVEAHRQNISQTGKVNATDAFKELKSGNKAITSTAFDTRGKADKALSGTLDKLATVSGYNKLRQSGPVAGIRNAFFDKNSKLYDAIDKTDASFAEKQMMKRSIDYSMANTARGIGSKELNDTMTHNAFVSNLNERSLLKNAPSTRKLYDDVSDYVKARHELYLMDKGVKNDNPQIRQAAEDVINKYSGEQRATLEAKYRQLQAAGQERLDIMRERGLLTEAKYNELKNNPDYIRVQRELNPETPDQFNKPGGVASIGQHDLIQKTGKSQAAMVDPIASYLDFNNRVGGALDRNRAANELLPMLERAGVAQKITPERAAQMEEWYGKSARYAENVGAEMVDGVAVKYDLPKAVAQTMKSQQRIALNDVEKILAMPTNFFKLLTTGINASFGSRNIVRDPQAAAIYSHHAPTFLKNFGKSVSSSVAESMGMSKDPLLRKYLTSEGEANFLDLTKAKVKNDAKAVVTKQARENAAGSAKANVRIITSNYFGSPIAGAKTLANLSEQITRYAGYRTAYQDALAKGFSQAAAHREGLLAARNNSIDFYKGGQYSKQMNIFMPYLNPAIQGVRKFQKTLYEEPATFLSRITTNFAVPVALSTTWNMQNDEMKNIYADIPEAEKNRNLIFVMPGMNVKGQKEYSVIKIPLAPGFSDFVQPVRRVIEASHGLNELKASQVFGDLIAPFSPFGTASPTQIASQTLMGYPLTKAVLEPAFNKNFYYNQDIVPTEMQGLPADEQVYKNTSGTARQIGGALGVSPLKVEAAVRGVFGGGANMALNSVDNIQKAFGGKNPDGTDITVGGRNVFQDVSRGFTSAKGGAINQAFFDDYGKASSLKDIRTKQINKLLYEGSAQQAQRKVDEYNAQVEKIMTPFLRQYGDQIDPQQKSMLENLYLNDIVISKKGRPYMKR